MKTYLAVTGLSLALCSAPLAAGPENVAWPGDYKNNFSLYFSGDRTANNHQIIRIYANQVAIDGKNKDGKLPHGSVLVGELYKAEMDEKGSPVMSLGQRLIAGPAAVVVMEKGQGFDKDYPDALKVGDWEFAVFNFAGKKLDKDITACRSCHHPLAQQEFLFSYQHLGR